MQRKETALEGRRDIRWMVFDEWCHRVYGFEVWDEKGDDRWGWAFVVERDGALEIEELCVRLRFRGRGHGQHLAERVAELIRAKAQT